MGELLGLSWDNYKDSMTGNLKTLIQDEHFVDVSLHCEGRMLRAHKVYLSACSQYFRSVLQGTSVWQHPILFLSEIISFPDLQKILEFVYCGEVQLPRSRLSSFLKSAEILKINGLLHDNSTDHLDSSEAVTVKRKKRRKESLETGGVIENIQTNDNQVKENDEAVVESEHVIVKADPEDLFQEYEDQLVINNDEANTDGSNRGIVVRNDLVNKESAPQAPSKI